MGDLSRHRGTASDFELYPAKVEVDGQVIQRARVYARDGRLLVFTANRLGQAELVVDRAFEGMTPKRQTLRPTVLVASGGSSIVITKGGGCPCNHPLKGFNVQRWLAEHEQAAS